MYYPHALPPCVRPDGSLHWDNLENDPEDVLLFWGDSDPLL